MQQSVPPTQQGQTIRDAVKAKYRAVAVHPVGHFPYPVGRESALKLGYRPEWLAALPAPVVEWFVGVGNPFTLRRPRMGEAVLDVGCGCGLDCCVAANLVGPGGRSIGMDLTFEMLEVARSASAASPCRIGEYVEGSVEHLPFGDATFDLVISNGALNLVPDKTAAFREIHRVLRPGGALAAADLVVVESIPEEILADMDAWST